MEDQSSTKPYATQFSTILSAYETELNQNELVITKPLKRDGTLYFVNENKNVTLEMNPAINEAKITLGLNQLLTLGTKYWFACCLTKEADPSSFKSLSSALKYKALLDSPEPVTQCFTIFGYNFDSKGDNPKLEAFTFKADNFKLAREWVIYFCSYIRPQMISADLQVKAQKIFIVSNPFGGNKDSTRKFESIMKPMLELAGLQFELHETKYSRHGLELLNKATGLSSYNSIAVLGGDGMLHEAINGLLTRDDWNIIRNIPLAIIPTGTSNGVASSLGLRNVEMSTICLIKETLKPLDIFSVSSNLSGNSVTYSVLDVMNGFFSDIDETTDKLRFLGRMRVDVAYAVRAIFLRSYKTRIYYLPENCSLENILNPFETNQTIIDVNETHGPRPSLPNILTGYNHFTNPIEDRLSPKWQQLDGSFVFVGAMNVPYIDSNLRFSETGNISSGSISIVYNPKPISRWNFIKSSLLEARDPGQGIFQTLSKEIKASVVILECFGRVTKDTPIVSESSHLLPHTVKIENRAVTYSPKLSGCFRVDGELIEGSAIQIEILPKLMNIISSC